MTTMTYTSTLTVVTCWCGITYAIPDSIAKHRLRQRDNNERQTNIFCPVGHTWEYTGRSALDAEREKAQRLERTLANREEDLRSERASHSATKGKLTKATKRATRGVCPVDGCKRSFVDVARHVATKHPESIQ